MPDGVVSAGVLDAVKGASGDFPWPVGAGIGGTPGSCCSFLVSGTASLLLLARCANVRAVEKLELVLVAARRGRARRCCGGSRLEESRSAERGERKEESVEVGERELLDVPVDARDDASRRSAASKGERVGDDARRAVLPLHVGSDGGQQEMHARRRILLAALLLRTILCPMPMLLLLKLLRS